MKRNHPSVNASNAGANGSGRQQMSTMNGKRPAAMPPRHHSQQPQQQQQQQQQPQPQQNDASSQHFDLIKYIYESWQSVSSELHNCHNQQHGNSSNYRNSANVTYYQESEPNPNLKDFEPFDLEALWSQRGASIARNTSSS